MEQAPAVRSISEVRRNLRWVRQHYKNDDFVFLTERIAADETGMSIEDMCHNFNRSKWGKRNADRRKASNCRSSKKRDASGR